MFNPSPQQRTIFDFVSNDTRSLIVEARAGSGKTTTLVELSKLIPKERSSLFLAFNKNIATELQSRLPAHIQAKTFHSHGFSALQRNLPQRPKVDADKTFKLLKDQLNRRDFDLYYKYVSRLIGYAKNAGLGTDIMDDTPANWWLLVDHYSLQLDSRDADEERALRLAQSVLCASCDDLTSIDFDDMLYLALKRNVVFDKSNYVMLDEAQDTNGVQRALLHRMLATGQPCTNCPDGTVCVSDDFGHYITKCDLCSGTNWIDRGRLIAVGDPAQSIYGFRGADADALDAIAREFNCETLPLSVSYRCSKAVIVEAQKTVPEIEHRTDAPDGTVERLAEYEIENFISADVILCRVTAPLVSMAFGFIKRNVGVRILGREIGAGLVALVKKLNGRDINDLSEKLDRWASRETTKAYARGHESAAAAVEDKHSCLTIFIEQLPEDSRTVSELIRRIESLFTNNNQGLLTLCSIHKAKGLEWDKVFILDREKYMPSKWARQEWELRQEENLIYVAVTRTKLDLRYIKSGQWKQPKQETTNNEKQLNLI